MLSKSCNFLWALLSHLINQAASLLINSLQCATLSQCVRIMLIMSLTGALDAIGIFCSLIVVKVVILLQYLDVIHFMLSGCLANIIYHCSSAIDFSRSIIVVTNLSFPPYSVRAVPDSNLCSKFTCDLVINSAVGVDYLLLYLASHHHIMLFCDRHLYIN